MKSVSQPNATHPKHAITAKQGFKASWVYAMAVGSAVGWGAFVLPYEWLTTSGLLAVVVGFLVGMLLVGVIAVNYGYATRALPVTGGSIAFALATFGRLHGFVAGWALLLGYASIISLNASAVVLVLRLLVPDVMMQGALYSVAGWTIYAPEVATSSLFLLGFAYLNVKNTAFSGWVQFVCVLMMLVSVALVLAGTATAFFERPLAQGGQSLPLFAPDGVSFWVAMGSVIAFAPWAYVGFDGVPQLAGEFQFSPKKVMALLLASVLSAGLLYVALILASAFAFGGHLADYAGSAWAVGLAVDSTMGKAGLFLMVLAVSGGVLTGLNGFYVATSRVVLTLGRCQMLPAVLSKSHPKHGTPSVAIWVIMAVCLISPWFGRASLLWIVNMASVGIAITFFYTCACAYKLGRDGAIFGIQAQAKSTKQQVFGVLGMAISLLFLALLFVPELAGVLDDSAKIALVVWAVFGLVVYVYRRRCIHAIGDDALKQTLFAKLHGK